MLKNRKTNEPLLVIIFTLLPKDGQKGVEVEAEKKEAASTGNDDDLD